MTHAEIAESLNIAPSGVYRDVRSRKFQKADVQRQLKRLFPSEMDVVQMLFALKELKAQEGWETLEYIPKYARCDGGMTLRSLTVQMPRAKELVASFGNDNVYLLGASTC